MRKFEYRYKIDEDNKVVVALSSFAGKAVAGVARCAPGDTFDIETGKRLAAARCALKIAEKRVKYAETCSLAAASEAEYWSNYQAKMESYEADSVAAYKNILTELLTLEKTL
jgi:hypothetical protein